MLRNAPLLGPLLALGLGISLSPPLGKPIASAIALLLSISLISFKYSFQRISAIVLFFLCGHLVKPDPIPLQKEAKFYCIQFDHFPEETTKTWRVKAKLIGSLDSSYQYVPRNGFILTYIDKRSKLQWTPGYTYIIRGNLQQIPPPERTTDFDFRTYMHRQQVAYQIWVKERNIITASKRISFSWKRWLLFRAREVGMVYHKWISPKEAADVTEAMITGRRDHLSPEVKDHYTAAGAVHVLAVSGMHITLVYGILTLLFRGQIWIWPKPWIKPKLAISILILTLYAGFTGMTASVMRATVMFYLIVIGQWFQRHTSSENLLYGTALILLAIEPNWLYDVGFQLSFGAVWGILTFYPILLRSWQPTNKGVLWIWELTALGLSAQMVTFPLTLYYFHQFPSYFYITNVVTAFLAGALVPLGLALWASTGIGNGPLSNLVGKLTGWCAEGLNWLNSEIANLPYSVVSGIHLSVQEVFLWYLLFMIWLWGDQYLTKKGVLWITVLFLYGWMCWMIGKDIIQLKRSEWRVWKIKNQPVVMKIQGKHMVVVSRRPIDEKTKQYVFKNFVAIEGIRNVDYLSLEK